MIISLITVYIPILALTVSPLLLIAVILSDSGSSGAFIVYSNSSSILDISASILISSKPISLKNVLVNIRVF